MAIDLPRSKEYQKSTVRSGGRSYLKSRRNGGRHNLSRFVLQPSKESQVGPISTITCQVALKKLSALKIKEEGSDDELVVVVAITHAGDVAGTSESGVCTLRDDICSIRFLQARFTTRYTRRTPSVESMVEGMDPKLSFHASSRRCGRRGNIFWGRCAFRF